MEFGVPHRTDDFDPGHIVFRPLFVEVIGEWKDTVSGDTGGHYCEKGAWRWLCFGGLANK